jgi:hypothetical protein
VGKKSEQRKLTIRRTYTEKVYAYRYVLGSYYGLNIYFVCKPQYAKTVIKRTTQGRISKQTLKRYFDKGYGYDRAKKAFSQDRPGEKFIRAFTYKSLKAQYKNKQLTKHQKREIARYNSQTGNHIRDLFEPIRDLYLEWLSTSPLARIGEPEEDFLGSVEEKPISESDIEGIPELEEFLRKTEHRRLHAFEFIPFQAGSHYYGVCWRAHWNPLEAPYDFETEYAPVIATLCKSKGLT